MLSKVLYIGDLYSNTLDSRINVELINFLSIDNDVYCRNTSREKYHENTLIDSLSKKKSDSFDYCIQSVNNGYDLVYDNACGKHLSITRPDNSSDSVLITKFDEISITPEMALFYASQSKDYGVLRKAPEIISKIKEKNKYIFYTVVSKENINTLDGVLMAYHKTFTTYDNVVLVIYTDVEYKILDQKMNNIHNICQQGYYPESTLINQKFSREKLFEIHQSADCYVGFSSVSTINFDAIDALLFDKTVICDEFNSQEINSMIYPLKINRDFVLSGCNKYQRVCSLENVSCSMRQAYKNRTNFVKRDLSILGNNDDFRRAKEILQCHEKEKASI